MSWPLGVVGSHATMLISAIPTAASVPRNHVPSTRAIDRANVTITKPQAFRFASRGTVLSRCHREMNGPNTRFASRRWWRAGEDRTKQAAASSMNGVVGSTGRNAPTAPRAVNSSPSRSRHHRASPVFTRFFGIPWLMAVESEQSTSDDEYQRVVHELSSAATAGFARPCCDSTFDMPGWLLCSRPVCRPRRVRICCSMQTIRSSGIHGAKKPWSWRAIPTSRSCCPSVTLPVTGAMSWRTSRLKTPQPQS